MPQAALAQERFEVFALLDSSPALLACPVSIAAAILTDTEGAVIALAAAMVLSGAVGAGWLLIGPGRSQRHSSPPGGPRAVLSFGLRAWASELLTQLNLRADLVLVGVFAGAAQSGVYSVALSTTSIAWTLTAAFAISALPRSARLHAQSEQALLDSAHRDASDARVMRHTMLVIPPLAIGELLLLFVGIPLFYGADFHHSIDLGLILLPGSLLLGVGLAAVAMLLARRRTGLVLRVGLAVVPATVLAYALLIPSGGADVAAIVSSISYVACAVLAVLALRSVSGFKIRELLLPGRADLEDYRALAKRGATRLGIGTLTPP